MKSLSATFKNMMKHAALVAAALFVAACDPILDNGYGDCTVRYHVTFKYDYNMLNVDAFDQQVEAVTLYAFNPADGTLAHQVTSTCADMQANGGRMTVDFNPADYHLVSWCHNVGCQTTQLPALTCGQSTISELRCRIGGRSQAADGCTQVCEIGPIFHGEEICPEPINPEDELNPTYLVPLMKNTNTVRVILQNLSDDPLLADDFDFRIVEENGLMNYDNSLLPDEELTYVPFYTGQGDVDYEGSATRADDESQLTKLNVAIAEFTFARLMADRHPRLTVTNRQTGAVVFSIPLTDYLKLARSQYVRGMSDQEYLDREDAYSLTFFLGEDKTWMSAAILINEWRVVLMDVDL